MDVFEEKDKTGRIIRLSQERWSHIKIEHPEIIEAEVIKQVIMMPLKILQSDRDEKVNWYFLYDKERKRYLKVSVKYLNGKGYIITAHYTKKIQ